MKTLDNERAFEKYCNKSFYSLIFDVFKTNNFMQAVEQYVEYTFFSIFY